MTKLSALLVAAALVSGAGAAHATNYIVNGGFETGDYTGWTENGLSGVASTGTGGWPSHSGRFFSFEGAVGSDHTLSQTFNDINGQALTIAFWYGSDGGTPNDLNVIYDGITIFTLNNAPSTKPAYTLFQFAVTATGNDTLTLGIRNDPSFQALDDVSVNSVPEPASLALLGMGVLGLGFLRRRKA